MTYLLFRGCKMSLISGKPTEYSHEAARQDLTNYVDYPDYAYGTSGSDPKHLQVKTETYAYHLINQATGRVPDKAKLLEALSNEVFDLTSTPDTKDIELLFRVKNTVLEHFQNDTMDTATKMRYTSLVGTLDNLLGRLSEMRQREMAAFGDKLAQPITPRSGSSSGRSSISNESVASTSIPQEELLVLKKKAIEIGAHLEVLEMALETGDPVIADKYRGELEEMQKNLAGLLVKIPEGKRNPNIQKLIEDNRMLGLFLRTITSYAKFEKGVNELKKNLSQRDRSGINNDQTTKMRNMIEESKETDAKYKALIGKTLFGHTIGRISLAST